MKEEYEKKGATPELCKLIEFDPELDAITLDIPMEGITIEDWEISPLMPPVVSSCVAIHVCMLHQIHECAVSGAYKGKEHTSRIYPKLE